MDLVALAAAPGRRGDDFVVQNDEVPLVGRVAEARGEQRGKEVDRVLGVDGIAGSFVASGPAMVPVSHARASTIWGSVSAGTREAAVARNEASSSTGFWSFAASAWCAIVGQECRVIHWSVSSSPI